LVTFAADRKSYANSRNHRKKDAVEFLLVNVQVNKDNPAYIRPLDKDINDVFDVKKNKTFGMVL
jgi:hypothetical protein